MLCYFVFDVLVRCRHRDYRTASSADIPTGLCTTAPATGPAWQTAYGLDEDGI